MVQIISSFSFLREREFQRTDVRSKTCNNVKINDDQTNLNTNSISLIIIPLMHMVHLQKKEIQFEVRIIEYFSE